MVFFVEVNVFCHIAHSIYHLFAFIKRHAFLAVVAEFHRFANFETAAVGLDFVEQKADKSGFSHTVIAHDAQFFIARKGVVEIVEYHLIAKSFWNVVSSENLLPDIAGLHIKHHIAFVVALLCAFFQVVEGIDTVLCLVSAGLRLASHPLNFGAKQIASFLYSCILSIDAFGSLFEVVMIVAFIGKDVILVKLQNFVANFV